MEQPAPLTPEEQAALKQCEAEIRASLEKYGCDIQGVASIATGNVQVNCVIVKVRQAPAPAPAAPATGVAAAEAPSAAPSA